MSSRLVVSMGWCLSALGLWVGMAQETPQVVPGNANGQRSESGSPLQIGLLVEVIGADRQLMDSLLYQYRNEGNDMALREKLDEYLEEGTASVSELAYVLTRAGLTVRVDSVVERLYPSEFDPAEVIQDVKGPLEEGVSIITHATPTAFQTRNSGFGVRAMLQWGENAGPLEMNVEVSGVVYEGDDIQGQGSNRLLMPRFFSKRLSAELVARPGEDVLLGTTLDAAETGRRELVFVRPQSLLVADRLSEDTERAPEPLNVATFVEYLEVPITELHPRMRALQTTVDATELRGEFDPLIRSGRVKRTTVNYLPTRTGTSAMMQLGRERIYGVEGDPPEMPTKLSGPIDPSVRIQTPLHRTTFEMRQEGDYLNVDPTWNRTAQVLDVSLSADRVRHAGDVVYGQAESAMDLPLFHVESIAANVSVPLGKHVLLGVHSDRSANGRNAGSYTMVFLSCSARGLASAAD